MPIPPAVMAPEFVTRTAPPASLTAKMPRFSAPDSRRIVPALSTVTVPSVLPASATWAKMPWSSSVTVSVTPSETLTSTEPASKLIASMAFHFERTDPPVTPTLTSPVFMGAT